MPRLRIRDIDSIQKYSDLVVGAAPDADVRLHAHRTPLAHIYSKGVFKQIINCLGGGRGDGQAVQQRNDAGTAVKRDRNPRCGNGNAVNRLDLGLRKCTPGR